AARHVPAVGRVAEPRRRAPADRHRGFAGHDDVPLVRLAKRAIADARRAFLADEHGRAARHDRAALVSDRLDLGAPMFVSDASGSGHDHFSSSTWVSSSSRRPSSSYSTPSASAGSFGRYAAMISSSTRSRAASPHAPRGGSITPDALGSAS